MCYDFTVDVAGLRPLQLHSRRKHWLGHRELGDGGAHVEGTTGAARQRNGRSKVPGIVSCCVYGPGYERQSENIRVITKFLSATGRVGDLTSEPLVTRGLFGALVFIARLVA